MMTFKSFSDKTCLLSRKHIVVERITKNQQMERISNTEKCPSCLFYLYLNIVIRTRQKYKQLLEQNKATIIALIIKFNDTENSKT